MKRFDKVGILVMGQSPKGDTYNTVGNGAPLLNGPTEFGATHPLPALWTTAPVRFCQPGDILFCVRGSTTGRMNWADRDYCIGRGIGAFRAKTGKKDTRFLYYSIVNDLPRLLALTSGSVFPNLSRADIAGFKLIWPDKHEREFVADCLGTLDDKIELNRAMNETLEEMARAIFKSWFVDFDPVRAKAEGRKPFGMDANTAALFPASFQDSPIGKIPKGWKVGTLADIIDIVGGGTPKTNVSEYWNGKIPWFSVVDAPDESDVFVVDTEKHISEAGLNNSSTKLLREGTTIISARGTVGKCALVGTAIAMNQSCYGIEGTDGRGDYFTYYTVRLFVSDLQRSGHGSVFNTIIRDTFKTIDLAIPSVELTKAFDNSVKIFMAKILNNIHQSQTLTAIRDALLPKLMSGEVRVNSLETVSGDKQ